MVIEKGKEGTEAGKRNKIIKVETERLGRE
jgi:hypothetical protein